VNEQISIDYGYTVPQNHVVINMDGFNDDDAGGPGLSQPNEAGLSQTLSFARTDLDPLHLLRKFARRSCLGCFLSV
jgi:hypothetical protein